MKIIYRLSDGAILHAGENLDLTSEAAVGDGWRNRKLNTGNAAIAEAALPADFVCGAYGYVGGQFVAIDQAAIDANTVKTSGKNNGKAADIKRRQIIQQYDAAVKAMTAGYDDQEISSWPQQAEEARAKNANPNAEAPLVAAIAQARGMTISEMVTRILQKEALFKPAYGSALGTKQARLAALSAIDLTSPDAATLIQAV